MRRVLPAVLALLTLALLAALWLQVPGANGPQEWRWEYRPPGLAAFGLPILFIGFLTIAVALAGVGRGSSPLGGGGLGKGGGQEGGGRSLDDGDAPLLASPLTQPPPSQGGGTPRPASRWRLSLLVLLGLALTLAVIAAQPGGFGRVLASLASRHSFSYVFDAGVAPPTRELLADYPAASENLDLHSRTHPPGPLLLVRGLDALTRRLPVPEGGLVAAARDAMEREVSRARARHRPAPEEPPSPWTLVLLAFLLPALSALVAWPLHRLARAWGLSPEAAACAVLLWLLTPARSLFTPSLDQALPLLLVGAMALAAAGGRTRAVVAGLLAAAACFLSYGCLATLPWIALVALGAGALSSPTRSAPLSRWTGWADGRGAGGEGPAFLAVGFLAPWIVLALATGYAPWRDFQVAIAAHRAMAVETRAYSTWVGWNLYDFALLAGPAVLGLALVALRQADRPKSRSYQLGLWGFWGLLALLDLSGSVRGEVGRIWLFFMPLAGLFAARALFDAADERRSRTGAALLALLQLALLATLAANLVFVS